MSPEQEIRLEVLKLLRLPDIANPDVSKFIERAKALEDYVKGAGHASEPPLETPNNKPPTQARNNQPVAGQARK